MAVIDAEAAPACKSVSLARGPNANDFAALLAARRNIRPCRGLSDQLDVKADDE